MVLGTFNNLIFFTFCFIVSPEVLVPKPLPLIVTTVPPTTEPLDGVMADTWIKRVYVRFWAKKTNMKKTSSSPRTKSVLVIKTALFLNVCLKNGGNGNQML